MRASILFASIRLSGTIPAADWKNRPQNLTQFATQPAPWPKKRVRAAIAFLFHVKRSAAHSPLHSRIFLLLNHLVHADDKIRRLDIHDAHPSRRFAHLPYRGNI